MGAVSARAFDGSASRPEVPWGPRRSGSRCALIRCFANALGSCTDPSDMASPFRLIPARRSSPQVLDFSGPRDHWELLGCCCGIFRLHGECEYMTPPPPRFMRVSRET